MKIRKLQAEKVLYPWAQGAYSQKNFDNVLVKVVNMIRYEFRNNFFVIFQRKYSR